MDSLVTTNRVMILLCLKSDTESSSNWKRMSRIAFIWLLLISSTCAIAGYGAFVLKYITINLNDSLFSMLGCFMSCNMLCTMIIVFFIRHQIPIVFDKLTKIHSASELSNPVDRIHLISFLLLEIFFNFLLFWYLNMNAVAWLISWMLQVTSVSWCGRLVSNIWLSIQSVWLFRSSFPGWSMEVLMWITFSIRSDTGKWWTFYFLFFRHSKFLSELFCKLQPTMESIDHSRLFWWIIHCIRCGWSLRACKWHRYTVVHIILYVPSSILRNNQIFNRSMEFKSQTFEW